MTNRLLFEDWRRLKAQIPNNLRFQLLITCSTSFLPCVLNSTTILQPWAICMLIKRKINLGLCKTRGKLSPVIRKVLSSKNYLGTLVRAIFQLNEWWKFVKLDDVGNILFFLFDKILGNIFFFRNMFLVSTLFSKDSFLFNSISRYMISWYFWIWGIFQGLKTSSN